VVVRKESSCDAVLSRLVLRTTPNLVLVTMLNIFTRIFFFMLFIYNRLSCRLCILNFRCHNTDVREILLECTIGSERYNVTS
jgi:hypothetical protein